MDSKKALVVISFGSTFDETRTHDIGTRRSIPCL